MQQGIEEKKKFKTLVKDSSKNKEIASKYADIANKIRNDLKKKLRKLRSEKKKRVKAVEDRYDAMIANAKAKAKKQIFLMKDHAEFFSWQSSKVDQEIDAFFESEDDSPVNLDSKERMIDEKPDSEKTTEELASEIDWGRVGDNVASGRGAFDGLKPKGDPIPGWEEAKNILLEIRSKVGLGQSFKRDLGTFMKMLEKMREGKYVYEEKYRSIVSELKIVSDNVKRVPKSLVKDVQRALSNAYEML